MGEPCRTLGETLLFKARDGPEGNKQRGSFLRLFATAFEYGEDEGKGGKGHFCAQRLQKC